jgi:predicted nucleic acid-binding protein
MLTVHAILVNAPPLAEPVSEDPDDDMFLAAAIAGRARVIVSGDKHLLRVSGWQQIEVLKARQFVDRYIEPAGI